MVKRERERSLAWASLASLVITAALIPVAVSFAGSLPRAAFGGMFTLDGFGIFFKVLTLLAAAVTILFSLRFVGTSPYPGGEYYALLLLTTVGMLFMASGTHLVSIYIALELMALSQYVLAGYFKRESKSVEAAAKYFVLGAFSSGVLLYGLSLVYGTTGTLGLAGVAQALEAAPRSPLLMVGVVLTACGMLFKIASAPFHVWAPDVYEGAPTPVSAFFAVGPKLAAYAIFARIFFAGFGPRADDWAPVLAASAALTMVVGNVGALMQSNVKRLLGYSSARISGTRRSGKFIFSFSIHWWLKTKASVPGVDYAAVFEVPVFTATSKGKSRKFRLPKARRLASRSDKICISLYDVLAESRSSLFP